MGISSMGIVGEEAWMDSARCQGEASTVFFPERWDHKATTRAEECLEYALTTIQKFGVWGGLSERQRLKIRKTRMEARDG